MCPGETTEGTGTYDFPRKWFNQFKTLRSLCECRFFFILEELSHIFLKSNSPTGEYLLNVYWTWWETMHETGRVRNSSHAQGACTVWIVFSSSWPSSKECMVCANWVCAMRTVIDITGIILHGRKWEDFRTSDALKRWAEIFQKQRVFWVISYV